MISIAWTPCRNPAGCQTRSVIGFFVRAVLLMALLSAVCIGQEYRSTITGRITDPQQAVVPNVDITVTETNTGARFKTISGAEGQYTVPFLLPGAYSITADVAGFKRYVHEGFTIGANERKALDIALEVGGTTESVNVVADAPLLATATASTGQVISEKMVLNLPLSGRSPLTFASLAYGVVFNPPPQTIQPWSNGSASGFAIAGAPNQQNEILIDGVQNSSMDSGGTINLVGYSPPVDAVSEVKVESFSTDGAYGHTGGGTINVVLKGGTNTFHGSAYEFNQASALSANGFFANKAGKPKTLNLYNQWGMSVGGPVMIPKVINGRNKLLFFFAYEGVHQKTPAWNTMTVPAPDQSSGDFSKLLALGANYQIYDPNTNVKQGAQVRRDPFPNNVIPPSRINPIAKALLAYYPAPNQAGTIDGKNNFYTSMGGTATRYANEIGRLDYNISDRHKLSFSVRNNESIGTNQDYFSNGATGNSADLRNVGGTIDDVFAFSPTMFLDVRFNAQRNSEFRMGSGDEFDIAALGFPASLTALVPHGQFPGFGISGIQALGSNAGGWRPYDNFQIFPTATKVTARHTLKFGGDLRLSRFSWTQWGWSTGYYNFDTSWTQGPLSNSPAGPTGQGMAAFLLGLPSSGQFDVNTSQTSSNGYRSVFLNDDFRVKKSLTLNLGIRYEYETPTVERFNRSTNGFDFTSPSPISAAAAAAYAKNPIPEVPVSQFKTLGGLLFANPNARNLYNTTKHNFSPRFGFAWTPSGLSKMVIRGGTGVYFFPNNVGGLGVNQPGFSVSTPLVSTLDGGLTPYATLGNPFPGGLMQATGSSAGLATLLGQGISFLNPNLPNGYSARWNLNVQRELPGNMVLEVGYIGNHAVRLPMSESLNAIPAQYLSKSLFRDQPTIDYLNANVPNPFAGLLPGTGMNGSVVQRNQLLMQYPQFTGVTETLMPDGSSFFHGLDVRLEKRYSHGLQFLANYEHSKLLSKTDRLNPTDPPYKETAWYDRSNNLAVGATWDLPLGKGKALGNTTNPVFSRLLGGWSTNVIYALQSGRPLEWGDITYFGGDLHLQPHNPNGAAFDITQFNRNSATFTSRDYRFLPNRFSNVRRDHTNNLDFSAVKTTQIRESVDLQYRCEFFNFLNRPQFGTPNVSPGSSAFGTITGQDNQPRRIQMALRLTW
jgi:hypothetical protein